jgi:hypothetical protein
MVIGSALAVAMVLTTAASASASRLTVQNRTTDTICYLYASRCASDSWGNDRLGDGTIASGADFDLNLADGCWDLRAEDCSETMLGERRGFQLSGNTSWTVGSARAAQTATVTVRNRTGGSVCYVYVSPCTSDHWGDDILEEDVLAVGESARVRVQHGCWDFKAEDCSHNVLATRTGVQVNGDTTWTLEGAQAAGGSQLTVRNRSGQTVCYLYASPCASDAWGEDRLGSDTLAPGESSALTLPNGCWDLRAEDCSNAAVEEHRGFRLNGSGTWNITGD